MRKITINVQDQSTGMCRFMCNIISVAVLGGNVGVHHTAIGGIYMRVYLFNVHLSGSGGLLTAHNLTPQTGAPQIVGRTSLRCNTERG